MGWARELKAAGVSGARSLIKKHGAMSATRNPNEMPADARVCFRFAEACSRNEKAREAGTIGTGERTEALRADT